MKRNRKFNSVLVLILLTASCTYYENKIFIPPITPVAEEKPTLEADYVSTAPNSINTSYWTTADYMVLNVEDIVKEQVSSDTGLLNVNGMFYGLPDFNGGEPAHIILKAAYDNENLYILASWNDKTFNASNGNWMYNGPKDPLKSNDTTLWTSQRGDDNLTLAFTMDGSNQDVWEWSLARSEPMGYAIDMHGDPAAWVADDGDKVFVRNAADTDPFRSGPKYQWNGQQQELTRDPGGFTILDPGYYILNKTEFTANIVNGEAKFQQRCSFCHGKRGEGHGSFNPESPDLREPGKYSRFSVEALNNTLSVDSTHDGWNYWNKLSETDKSDVVARLRAFGGIPGYYLQNPSGSSADVRAYSNSQLAKINYNAENSGYKVLLIRKLQTGNSDDIQFNISENKEYTFHVYLADNDLKNRIGEETKQLTFK